MECMDTLLQTLGNGEMPWLAFQFEQWDIEPFTAKWEETIPYPPPLLRAAAFITHYMERYLQSTSPHDPGSDSVYLPEAVQASLFATRFIIQVFRSCREKDKRAPIPDEDLHLLSAVARFCDALLANREAPHLKKVYEVVGVIWGYPAEESIWRLEYCRRKAGEFLDHYHSLRNARPPVTEEAGSTESEMAPSATSSQMLSSVSQPLSKVTPSKASPNFTTGAGTHHGVQDPKCIVLDPTTQLVLPGEHGHIS